MKATTFHIPGPVLIDPNCFPDPRGYFIESFKASAFKEYGIPQIFSQDNHSRSTKNVLRGLHFQAPPMEQGKLVRVTRGRALDVIVDIRLGSPTYGEHLAVELSDGNKHIFWVPPGFAHGFLTLEDNTDFLYKVTNEYSKEHEGGLLFNDPALGINWGVNSNNLIVSDKDKILPHLKDFQSPFQYQ